MAFLWNFERARTFHPNVGGCLEEVGLVAGVDGLALAIPLRELVVRHVALVVGSLSRSRCPGSRTPFAHNIFEYAR